MLSTGLARSILLCLGLLLGVLLPSPTMGQIINDSVIEKTYCTSGLGYDDINTLRQDLLIEVKRLAASELFGELITASTLVENLVVTHDQIYVSSVGLIRLQGDIVYSQGENLAEVCVTIRAYTTDADRALFTPFELNNRICISEPTLTVRQVRERAEEEAIVRTLIDYDRRLADVPKADLLKLLRQVEYVDSSFLSGTESYCVNIIGYVIPIEVMLFLESASTQASAHVAIPTSEPMPVTTPTTLPTVTPTKPPSPTPSPVPSSTAVSEVELFREYIRDYRFAEAAVFLTTDLEVLNQLPIFTSGEALKAINVELVTLWTLRQYWQIEVTPLEDPIILFQSESSVGVLVRERHQTAIYQHTESGDELVRQETYEGRVVYLFFLDEDLWKVERVQKLDE